MYGTVYKITNLLNKKLYVGITCKTIECRFQAHLDRAIKTRSAIQKAMKKYGKENFTIEVIDTANSKIELFEKEVFWIEKLDTFNNGYNLTKGGGGIPNMSLEIRNKISKTKTGKSIPSLKGREISKKQRIMISKTLNGKMVRMYNPFTKHEIILEWINQAREYGFNPSNVVSVCKGKRSHTKNYYCQYIQGNPDRLVESNNSTKVQRIDSETVKNRI